MQCRAFTRALGAWIGGEFESAERREIELHAQHCPVCASYLGGYLKTIDLVRGAYRKDSEAADSLDPKSRGA